MKAITYTKNNVNIGIGLSNSATIGARIVRVLAIKLHIPIAVALLMTGNISSSLYEQM